MSKIKEYTINLTPIAYKRPGLAGKTFYDRKAHERIQYDLSLKQQHGEDPVFEKPVQVKITFYMPRELLIAKRKRVPWAIGYPYMFDLERYIVETINNTGCIWKTDRIVASMNLQKIYDDNPRTHIVISEL